MVDRLRAVTITSVRSAQNWAEGRLMPHVLSWWRNPLLHHAQRLKPMPLNRVRRGLVIGAGALAFVAILAWITHWRPGGAALMGLSLGGVLAPVAAAPVASADRVARQMRFSRQDPRRLTDLDSPEVVWGLALVTLWRLRWLIVAALALTPALVVSILRLDVSDFTVWRDSARALGDATAAGRAVWLRPDGRIPYVRLVMRALSAGLVPWVTLFLMSTLGVTAALVVRDISLSPLAALLGEIVVSVLVLLVWDGLTRTPLLAGLLELLRLALLAGLLTGLGALTAWLNRQNAAQLDASMLTEDE